MKKIIILVAGVCCALSITLNVGAAGKPELTDDQKKVQKEMLEKYDANKDGKLDKDERAKMSQEDKDKWAKAFPHKKKSTDDKKTDTK